MKVTSNKVGSSPLSGTDAAGSAAKASKTGLESLGEAKAGKINSTSSEKVNLSQRVQDMQKIKELATPDNSINEAKVAALQKLIDEGKYKVDADAIADRMVDEHLTFPS